MLTILVGVGVLALVALLAHKPSSAVVPANKKAIAVRRIALLLLKYVQSGKRDKAKISRAQRIIGVSASGVPDAATHARIEKLLGFGVDWPGLSAKEKEKRNIKTPAKVPAKDPLYALLGPGKEVKFLEAAKPAKQPARQPAKQPARQPAKQPARQPAKQPARQPAKQPAAQVSAMARWAAVLDAYIMQGGRDRIRIAEYQRGIQQVDPDGYATFGTVELARTAYRVAALLSRQLKWPKLTTAAFTGPATSPLDPKSAALELFDYVHVYGGSHKERVAAYQKAMNVTPAIGNIGPITKTRVKSLTGKDL